jgi:hypothetical protein
MSQFHFEFDRDPGAATLAQIQRVLVIELKKGGSVLTRDEANQADGYVSAWVVGHRTAAGVAPEKEVGDMNRKYGRIRAATFGHLVDTANLCLLKLRTVLADRYEGVTTDQLLNRVLSQPVQKSIAFSSNSPTTKPGTTDG